MEYLVKLPSDVLTILAMTIFFVAVKITGPDGKNPTRNLCKVIEVIREFFRGHPPDKSDRGDK